MYREHSGSMGVNDATAAPDLWKAVPCSLPAFESSINKTRPRQSRPAPYNPAKVTCNSSVGTLTIQTVAVAISAMSLTGTPAPKAFTARLAIRYDVDFTHARLRLRCGSRASGDRLTGPAHTSASGR